MTAADWPEVRRIYAEGIATGVATFETAPPEWPAWDATHTAEHRYVAVEDDVLGWAASSAVSGRCVYTGVLEISIYVAGAARGRGVGGTLMAALIASTERAGVWTLQSGVFPDNAASLAMHRRHGFRVVGTRERIGQLNGQWRDVVLLERRSTVV